MTATPKDSDIGGEHWPIDWSRMHHGICPKCGEDKFIGHGPLCVDCYLAAPPAKEAV